MKAITELGLLEILKLGLVGLAFLFAYLAFMLLRAEQKKEESRPEQMTAIFRFMVFSLVLAGMVAIGPLLAKAMEDKPNPMMQAMLESAKNRPPMSVEFVESQIDTLTLAHVERIKTLNKQLDRQQELLIAERVDFQETRRAESNLRRLEQQIRRENTAFNSKINSLRRLL